MLLRLAAATPGCAGADLAALCSGAAEGLGFRVWVRLHVLGTVPSVDELFLLCLDGFFLFC